MQQRQWKILGISLAFGCGAALAAAAAAPALAHHGWGNYDSNQQLTLTGEVREASYENPHGLLKLAAPDKTWSVILAPPSRMQNRGLPPEAMKPGTKVTVVGYPHKSEPAELRAERIIIGGVTTELR
jgi:Family of unknown function (DUF6152)